MQSQVTRRYEGLDASATPASCVNPGVSSLPWRSLALEAARLWLVWQAALLLLTYAALTFTLSAQGNPGAAFATPSDLVNAWIHSDSAWYLRIAGSGYDIPQALAFFPLYPLLVHLATPLCLGNAHLAAVLVARLADYGVCLGILALAWQELGPRLSAARLALALTLVYPLAFFLAAAYGESLFLTGVAFALLFARRRAWGWAAAVTFLAAISHPRGLLLSVPLVWEWARVELPWRSWRDQRVWRDGLLVLGAIPAAYLAMAAISWQATGGDPLAFVHVHGDFDRVALEPWLVVRLFFGILYRSSPGSFSQAQVVSDVGPVALIVLVIGLGVVYRRIPASFALYTIGLVVLTIASPTPSLVDPFVSSGRLLIPALPVFLLLAAWAERRPWLTWLLGGTGLSLQVVLATFFINGGWLI